MGHDDQTNAMLQAMDDLAHVVAFHTGLRQQFIDQGWTPAHAELMVIECVRAANNAGVD